VNPSELLASQKMRTLHERLKPHTDFILVDTPSAIAFSDSTILSSFLDSVLLVVRAQEAPRGGEHHVREMLNKARANIVGVVLNGVKPQLVDSYFYHSAYYPPPPVERTGAHALPAPPDQSRSVPPGLPDGYEPTLMGVTFNHAYPPPQSPAVRVDTAGAEQDAEQARASANEIVDLRRSRGR